MSGVCPYIYNDYRNNIWKFLKSDHGELRYNIMYGEGKWTKESLIDTEVIAFAVYVEDAAIHIVYSNVKGELKYCTMKNKQWVGKVLYSLDNDEFKIQDVKMAIIGEEMHIFYMLSANDGSDHGVLAHCRWNGREVKVDALQDIILPMNSEDYYKVVIRGKDSIEIFFITDEGDEVSLKYCSLQKNRWTPVKRLYGIQGDKICFEVIINDQEIHILNKSKENSTYLLDYVYMGIDGAIQEHKIYESSKELLEPILFIDNGKLYSCWIQDNRVFYSAFDNERWGKPVYYERQDEVVLDRYISIQHDEDNEIRTKMIYGAGEPDLQFLLPEKLVKNTKTLRNYQSSEAKVALSKEDEEFENIKSELAKLKVENKNLEKKVAAYNMQLQKKQRFIEEYEDSIVKLMEQKRKVEENYNIYLEVQQNIQKELERTKLQLSDSKILTESIEVKLKERDEENELLRKLSEETSEINKDLQKQIKSLNDENMMLHKDISETKVSLNEFKGQNEKIKEENVLLQRQVENTQEENDILQKKSGKVYEESEVLRKQIDNMKERNEVLEKLVEQKKEENLKLEAELQFEKNQSFMNRLLRRKSSEV